MTPEQYTAIDKDVAAQVMDWRVITPGAMETLGDVSDQVCVDVSISYLGLQRYRLRRGDGYEMWDLVPWWPSRDFNATWEMEAEIERRGLQGYYVAALGVILDQKGAQDHAMVTMFSYIHATPEQRCRAATSAARNANEHEHTT